MHGILLLGIFYFLLAAAVIILAIVATKMDPTDPLVYKERRDKELGYVIHV